MSEMDMELLNSLFNKLKDLKKTKKRKRRGANKMTYAEYEKKIRKAGDVCVYCGSKLIENCGFVFCKNGHRDSSGKIIQPISEGTEMIGTMKNVKRTAPRLAYNKR